MAEWNGTSEHHVLLPGTVKDFAKEGVRNQEWGCPFVTWAF